MACCVLLYIVSTGRDFCFFLLCTSFNTASYAASQIVAEDAGIKSRTVATLALGQLTGWLHIEEGLLLIGRTQISFVKNWFWPSRKRSIVY